MKFWYAGAAILSFCFNSAYAGEKYVFHLVYQSDFFEHTAETTPEDEHWEFPKSWVETKIDVKREGIPACIPNRNFGAEELISSYSTEFHNLAQGTVSVLYRFYACISAGNELYLGGDIEVDTPEYAERPHFQVSKSGLAYQFDITGPKLPFDDYGEVTHLFRPSIRYDYELINE